MQKSGHLVLEQAAPHPEKSYHNMEVARSRATGARHPEYDNWPPTCYPLARMFLCVLVIKDFQ